MAIMFSHFENVGNTEDEYFLPLRYFASGFTRNRIHKTELIKKHSIEYFLCKCILCSILVAIHLEYPFFTY
ncbi:Uncharacterised protein [Klebsiella variicola]|nr:Uncharacterised protein [Klebsiella variicola]